MEKLALGIHHLNVAYDAGSVSSYHRQVREGIAPFMDLLFRHPTWCFTVEMSGLSVEFLATHYRGVFERLKELIERSQVEFVSSSYSPQIWIAFPRLDLLKSIQLNQKILSGLGLQPSRIFFSQENFSGEGIKSLGEWFDIAVLKEDYYFYLYDEPEQKLDPYFMLGDIKTIIGGGHLLEELFPRLYGENDETPLSCKHKKEYTHHQKSSSLKSKKPFVWQHGSLQWKWFHVGSSERFGKLHIRPDDLNNCRFDADWFFQSEDYLEGLEKDGFRFCSIGEFLRRVDSEGYKAQPLNPLVEGAWNMEESKGGFIWMGLNTSKCEDDLLIRNHNWRSRARLIGLETLIDNCPEEIRKLPLVKEAVSSAWKSQLLSETSDSTGWFPNPSEVQYGIQQSELVLNIVAQTAALIKSLTFSGLMLVDTKEGKLLDPRPSDSGMKQIGPEELFIDPPDMMGIEGEMYYFSINDHTQRIFLNFKPVNTRAALCFRMSRSEIVYSPSLMEDEILSIPLDSLKPAVIYLPLTNGLISLGEDVFLIKHNEFMNIACCIQKADATASFIIENPQEASLHWELTVFKGKAASALALANLINVYPVVVI